MADSPQRATPPVLAPNLEAQLTCSICTDLLHQPLTLLDCLHTFCGACLKEWFHFQAERIETAPGPPPPPSVPIFTCPSCRDGVRDTKHDARVFSLLDMFVALNPGRGKSEEEKREMDARYRKGERVMPRVRRVEERTEEERRADEEERRLVEEARAVSLREATERVAASSASSSRGGGRGGGRRRSESRQRGREVHDHGVGGAAAAAADVRARQVEHQSSLRSLISTDGMDIRDIEREVEAFARQIQEEGLLDGLDLDNLDLENNDELSRKITEAYRRRHRERRRDGGRRSNASANSHRSEILARPRSRTDETSRPTSRHAPRSRAPSVGSNEERGRYPPSSSALLGVQEPTRRRRASSSGGRSATLPIVPTQAAADIRVGSRAQTDLTSRAGATDSHVRRPSMGIEARSSSSPTSATAPVSRMDSPRNRELPFSARAAGGLGVISQAETRSSSASSRQRSSRPPTVDVRPESPTLGSVSGPISPTLISNPPPSPPQPQLPRYKEPLINCSVCHKEHIEYELHFNCYRCHNGEWNICLDCWRRRKGCLHWFSFGSAAWARWEKQNLSGPPTPHPHTLTNNRYLPPKQVPGGAEGRRVLTTENPLDRLQSGTFCSCCSAFTNDCYWRCDVCNDGEWGFCNGCVEQGKSCSHPLLALAYNPPPPLFSSSLTSPPVTTTTTPTGTFQPLFSTPPCSSCRLTIPQTDSRFPCYICTNPHPTQPQLHEDPSQPPPPPTNSSGSYICIPCYTALLVDGSIAPENGPAGWWRCLRGHRMVVMRYVLRMGAAAGNGNGNGAGQHMRRRVERDLVGGQRLRFEAAVGGVEPGVQVVSWVVEGGGAAASSGGGGGGGGGTGRRVERLFAEDVRVDTAALGGTEARFVRTFPPDGGVGPKAVAGWGWTPAAGGEDELMFPRGAEVLELEDVNGEWFHGFYMGAGGLFPAPYVRVLGRF
ncbi:hypothetical protein CHGG_05688 [Chaetomium globosum CBS 148.51]|uniref:RING-type domain-containing protein n=1 Tax=Chaetomium globosum (strain ATCC 6205 / CBS 148.51 / DSM 1962 / NBRC 6347 / NRRL 1970) TaxID=306901 RepID=Q2H6M7_CHAGB|nr:uncharacterized protein CHGG_05688 [Chaetomium globosum CBS 148.51]EAQ89069.1 hypothetical protein CHGG_05688 [Chaetomium globosum CBS 148.51]